METNLSDEDLVKKALKDIAFFSELVERYEKKLFFYILRISHFSAPEAEEILQEVFLKVWKNLNGFDKSLKFSSWIYRITHNETVSAFRKYTSRGEDQKLELESELFENLPDQTNFAQDLDAHIQAEKIQKLLQTLNPKIYREVLILKYFENKSYEEISDILQKPPGTIATLLHRSKKAFGALLEKS